MLTGKKTTLRPWIPADLDFLGQLRNDIETQRALMSLPRPNSPRRVQEWLDRKSSAEDGLFFVIAENGTSQPVGFLEIRSMNFVHGWGWLGICLDRSARGKGFAQESLALVEKYCQHTFGLRKILLEVVANNTAAIKLYKKSGYETVGVHREHFFQDGKYWDVMVMEKKIAGAA